MNKDYVGQNVLITTQEWFYAPDGRTYRAVWGRLKAIKQAEESLGIKPNARSVNWYVEIGNMTIAGCQINYAIKAARVNFSDVTEHLSHDGQYRPTEHPTHIYNAGEH
jgi:hypothetical protein